MWGIHSVECEVPLLFPGGNILPVPYNNFTLTGHDIKTVKKYINMEDFNQPLPKLVKKRDSKLDKYKGDIDDWLEEDKKFHRKQRHTALKVFDRLKEENKKFDCSYRLVATYVAEKKRTLYSQKASSTCP